MASTTIYVIGALSLLASVAGLVFPNQAVVGWWGIPVGVTYIALGWGVQGRRSMTALYWAFGSYLTVTLYEVGRMILSQSSEGRGDGAARFALVAIVVRIAFLVPMFGGFGALAAMRADRRRAEST